MPPDLNRRWSGLTEVGSVHVCVEHDRHAGTVNAGFTADGMPVGLQVIGPHFADLEVLTALACLEDALGLDRSPDLHEL